MDPSSYLDHALFQLTPTRTRCDLMIVASDVSERLASGLLEPFVSHLKCAKDQISKGGYSITLCPEPTYAPWFTKATLQRFVRFVSTPEVIERFVTIEKEIVQIEGSSRSNEAEGNVSYAEGRVKRSTISSNQDGNEENSRVRLQRVLDNRKAMLCKEQAMAYARALVAGFYPESMDDLICFADAFGASRLREACLNFLELCKQKNEDKLWMDEIAAMQVSSQPVLPYLRTSGIILAGEDDSGSKITTGDASVSDSTPSHASFDIGQDYSLPASVQTPSSDGRAQMPRSWPNHHPHYIHNFQGHGFQQTPPYQGYMYPGMQVPSPYYPGNMQWPPNGDRSHIVHDQEMDSHKKKKKKNKKSQVLDHSEEDESTASSESTYESDSDDNSKRSNKKHGKKSSRKVVIRNINYITSNGDGEKGSITEGSLSNEEEFINGNSLKHKVEEAVASLDKRNRSTSRQHKKQHSAKPHDMLNGSRNADSNGIKGDNNWDAFQNLLLIDDDDSTHDIEKQPMKFQEEYTMTKKYENGRSNEFNHHEEGVTKTRVVSNDSFVVAERELDSKGRDRVEYFNEGKDGSTFMQTKKITNEELLLSQRNNESGSYYVSSSARDYLPVEKNKKGILADDSFMIQDRPSQYQFNSQTASDISLVSDVIGAAEFTNGTQEGSHKKTDALISHEPDDLLMVLDRDSAVQQNGAPWRMEMDNENNISLYEANKKISDARTERNHVSNHEGSDKKNTGAKSGKVSSKEAKSKTPNAYKTKSDIMSRSRTLPGSRSTVTKSKSEKEEENRKRREELMMQRQKRIAERSALKKTGTETKTSLTSARKGNPKIHPSNGETKKLNKPVLRSSTIDRLATARVTQQKVSPSQVNSGPTKKPSLKANKLVPLQKKQLQKQVKSSNHKEDAHKTKGKVLSKSGTKTKNEIKTSVGLPVKPDATEAVEQSNNNHGLKDIGVLTKASPEKHLRHLTSEREIMHENIGQLRTDSSLSNHDHAMRGSQSRNEEVSYKLPSLHGDNNQPRHNTDMITNSTAAIPNKPLIYTAVNSKVNQEIEESNATSPKVSEIQISTPPPSNQAMQESIHNRKKWINDEADSSKVAKGFRKLIFFGRRS